jgi:acetyl/propionyl-CoA carboxylase alpha subunit
VGAGTVEFLLDGDGGWCFLELNARLQVEHPVTEAVCGIDLVRSQLEIAMGHPLDFEQEDVMPRGHAIECRLYAEDPAAGFVPAVGTLLRFELPQWPGVRCDAGARPGDRIGVRYDPMLAKLIAHAEDRDACVDRMSAALAATIVLGVTTNLGFLRWALDDEVFRAGEATTEFVEQRWSQDLIPPLPEGTAASGDDVWHAFGQRRQPADVIVAGDHALHHGWAYRLAADDQRAVSTAAPGSLSAPMPGTVQRILVEEGDSVDAGDVLMLLEAMKMELTVVAPAAGVVAAVLVAEGELVAAGQRLIEVEA